MFGLVAARRHSVVSTTTGRPELRLPSTTIHIKNPSTA